MCGLSGAELVVIVVAAVILLGPDKLPEVMRLLGRLTREVRKITGDLGKVTEEIRDVVSVEDLKKQLREEMQLERVRSAKREVESEIDAIRAKIRVDGTKSTGAGDASRAPRSIPDTASSETDAATGDDGGSEVLASDTEARAEGAVPRVRAAPGSVAREPSWALDAPLVGAEAHSPPDDGGGAMLDDASTSEAT